ncbi:MAG: alpha/beta fold hydrolase [Planctomycetota bacterium]
MTEELRVDVLDVPVRALRAGPSDGAPLLLLHGAAFSSETWRDFGTLDRCAAAGLRVCAVDLPGYGATPSGGGADRGAFLAALVDALGLDRPVVVAPSMSGTYALPLALDHADRCGGFVPVAPAMGASHRERLGEVAVPTLVVWGTEDRLLPVSEAHGMQSAIPGAELLLLEGARHPAYLDRTEVFHERLVRFVVEARGTAIGR